MGMQTYGSIDRFALLNDAYNGEGGFEAGGYILQHKRELADDIYARRQLSYFLNYTAPVVNSHVDPIFRMEARRDWGGAGVIEQFTDDVDAAGTGIHDFMKRAAITAKLHGVAFIVIDNFSDQPVNVADLLAERKFPFAYILGPDSFVSMKTDRFGRLVEIKFCQLDDNGKPEYATWTRTSWLVTEDEAGKKTLRFGDHNLGVVPVVRLYSRKQPRVTNDLPMSEFYQVARTNYRLYNLCSEIDEITRGTTFAMLIYPGNPKDLTIGVNKAIGFDKDGKNIPAFIAPDSGPLNMLLQYKTDLITDIFVMARLSHLRGIQQQSGVAKQWDFEYLNIALADFARNCQQAENQMLKMFSLWSKMEADYTATYKDDFSFRDTEQLLKESIFAIQDVGVSPLFKAALEKKLAGTMLNDIEDDEYDAILEEITARGEMGEPEPTLPKPGTMPPAIDKDTDKMGAWQ